MIKNAPYFEEIVVPNLKITVINFQIIKFLNRTAKFKRRFSTISYNVKPNSKYQFIFNHNCWKLLFYISDACQARGET